MSYQWQRIASVGVGSVLIGSGGNPDSAGDTALDLLLVPQPKRRRSRRVDDSAGGALQIPKLHQLG